VALTATDLANVKKLIPTSAQIAQAVWAQAMGANGLTASAYLLNASSKADQLGSLITQITNLNTAVAKLATSSGVSGVANAVAAVKSELDKVYQLVSVFEDMSETDSAMVNDVVIALQSPAGQAAIKEAIK
jgi:hypothetical protein